MLNNNTSTGPKSQASAPKLAPPGAGVPLPQKLMMRFYIGPFIAGRAKWVASEQAFHKMNDRILKEIEGLTEKQLATKILVPSQIGLEDSSRYWSIAMVLEHIVIVGEAITSGITLLSSGKVPPVKVDLAAVKPLGELPVQTSVMNFKKFATDDFKNFLQQVKDKDSKLTFHHPWFGPFKASQWFWLLGTHGAVHLKQIREIKKRLTVV
jgi:hypothetical protein